MSQNDGGRGDRPALGEPAIRRWLVAQLALIAGLDESEIDTSAPFSHYGVDSAAAAELLAGLEEQLDRELDPTVVFSFESPTELASYLAAGGTGHERARTMPRLAAPRPEGAVTEPIALVGLACRFPGAPDPGRYWDLLAGGVNAVGTVPDGRWDDADVPDDLPPFVRLGGFVESIDQFDPAFFGISQHEADRMDPQQRLLLQVAWEALEDASVVPSDLRGTPTGVFVGISANEYGRRQSADPDAIDVFFGTGNALSIAANRISYALDLRGPSVAVDTACSSSLVALHLACAALRRGECEVALAGGANAILTPLLTLNFTNVGVIAPDGRCKTFDAAADGIVRGEGAGVVVLKPLSRAVADGDRIYCVVEGSAMNSDGRSNGLTAPNPDAQVEVFLSACADAGIEPSSVGFVEAHGTGTVLGDAMELRSLDAVYGSDRQDPLVVGSVKTNIGHLESAAGIAGTIKAALALHHGAVPPNLHYEHPNPYLEESGRLQVARELRPWPEGARRAGVSGFGFGGTNAHVVLGPAPEAPSPTPTAADPADGRTLVLPLSARSGPSLAALAGRHAELLAAQPSAAADLAAAQALTREQHPRRAAVVADDVEELQGALAAVAAGRNHRSAHTGERRGSDPAGVVFVFSGQGRAWWPFDEGLLTDPVIRPVLEQCDVELRELVDWSLMDVLRAGDPVLDHERAQPLLFALQVALAARWRAFGVVPDLIIGQSIGEIAAAHVAGAIRLADGLELVLNRGRFMEESNGTGHTAFVELPEAEVRDLIDELGVDVTIAGVTAPDNCLVSGPKDDTVRLVDAATGRGVMAQVFRIGDIPGHGPLMSPYAEKLAASVDFLEPRRTKVPMVSTVTGKVVAGEDLDPRYWADNLRRGVRFIDAMSTAVDLGGELFLEVAPHPVVSVSARRCLESFGVRGVVQHTVKQGEPGQSALRRSLAAAWAAGATVDWRAVTGRTTGAVAAPTYPWDQRRCWFEVGERRVRAVATPPEDRWHPLLGRARRVAGAATTTWEAPLAGVARALQTGDGTDGTDRLAVGTVLEVAAAAVRDLLGGGSVRLDHVRLAVRPQLDPSRPATLQVVVAPGPDGLDWRVASRTGDEDWHTVATGGAVALDDDELPPPRSPAELATGGDRVPGDLVYAELAGGRSVEAAARTLREVVPADGSALATLRVADAMARDDGWAVHPLVLDGALAAQRWATGTHAPLQELDRLVLRRSPDSACRALVTGDDVLLVDEWGAPVVELLGVRRAPDPAGWQPPAPLLVSRWEESTGTTDASEAPPTKWFCVAEDDDPLAAELAARLHAERGDLHAWLDSPGAGAGAVLVLDRLEEEPTEGLRPLLDTVEQLLAHPGVMPRLVAVTVGARSVDAPAEPGPARVAALLPTITVMHPEYRPTSIDVGSVTDVEQLLEELRSGRDDDAVVLRHGRRLVGRLAVVDVPDAPVHELPADGVPHRAVRTAHGVRVERAAVPTAGLGQVLVEVAVAVVAPGERDGRPVGSTPGTAGAGTVVAGDGLPSGTPVAFAATGTAATHVVVDAGRAVPLDGTDVAHAGDALARLVELHPQADRLAAADGDLVAAVLGHLLHVPTTGPSGAARGELADLDDLEAVATGPVVLSVGAPDTLLVASPERWDADPGGTYLVVGGDDPATRFVSGFLADRGAGRVVVAHHDPSATGTVESGIVEAGPALVDLGDPDAVGALVGSVGDDNLPLRGIACVSGGRPPVADVLDLASAGRPLDLFLVVGATLSMVGAGEGSASDDAVGHVAVRRRLDRGHGALALDLGPLSPDGGADGGDLHRRHLAHAGLVPARADDAGRVLDRLLLTGARDACWVQLDEDRFTTAAGGALRRPWFAALAPAADLPIAAPAADLPVAGLLAAAPEGERWDLLTQWVTDDLAEILGMDASDIDDSRPVDDYGVDSLVGMELRSRFEKELGYLFPLSELSRTMSTRELAGHLHTHAMPALLAAAATGTDAGPAAAATAVPVRSGDGPPSWWAPGLFGAPESFVALGDALGREMWAFRAPGLDQGRPVERIEELAEAYLAALRDHQPDGPYHLGGYSFGGLVAVEMALRLEAAGEQVAHLWLLDPPPPSAASRARTGDRVAGLLADHLNALYPPRTDDGALTAADLPPLDRSDGAALDDLAARLATGSTAFDAGQVATALGRLWRLVGASVRAMAGYEPGGTVHAPVTLAHAEERSLFVPPGAPADAEWATFTDGGIDVVTLSTDHAGVLEPPHTDALAAVVQRDSQRAAASAEPVAPALPAAGAQPGRLGRALVRLSESQKVRNAVGAAGAGLTTAEFYLRSLAAERRFRKLCTHGESFFVGDSGRIVNLSGDPDHIRLGDHVIIDGYLNVQEYAYLSMGSYSGISTGSRIDVSGYVEIGNGCTIAQDVYIIDGLHHPLLANARIEHGIELFEGAHIVDAYSPGTEVSFVKIEDLVWIGLRAIILSGVTIGRGSVIAAGAVVSSDVPPFSVVAGNPGKVIGRIPADEFDIERHPAYVRRRGNRPLPDTRRDTREVLDEIARKVAARGR